jgi:hypothetical protein
MTTPEQYIAKIEEPKRSDVAKLHALIKKTVPAYEPAMYGSMIGYGRYQYRYESGREGVSYRIALSSNKTGISVYVCAVDEHGWLAEQAKDELGKASVGKSCIRFKRLADINLAALTTVLKKTKKVAPPGAFDAPTTKTKTKKRPAPTKKKRSR